MYIKKPNQKKQNSKGSSKDFCHSCIDERHIFSLMKSKHLFFLAEEEATSLSGEACEAVKPAPPCAAQNAVNMDKGSQYSYHCSEVRQPDLLFLNRFYYRIHIITWAGYISLYLKERLQRWRMCKGICGQYCFPLQVRSFVPQLQLQDVVHHLFPLQC